MQKVRLTLNHATVLGRYCSETQGLQGAGLGTVNTDGIWDAVATHLQCSDPDRGESFQGFLQIGQFLLERRISLLHLVD